MNVWDYVPYFQVPGIWHSARAVSATMSRSISAQQQDGKVRWEGQYGGLPSPLTPRTDHHQSPRTDGRVRPPHMHAKLSDPSSSGAAGEYLISSNLHHSVSFPTAPLIKKAVRVAHHDKRGRLSISTPPRLTCSSVRARYPHQPASAMPYNRQSSPECWDNGCAKCALLSRRLYLSTKITE